jgi:hypothetical protein
MRPLFLSRAAGGSLIREILIQQDKMGKDTRYVNYEEVTVLSKTLSLGTSLVAWWSELLTTNHEVPGSIPGSAVGIFPCRGKFP